ncbi:MAG: CBS domain-containing protein [Chloroflexota bacterium]
MSILFVRDVMTIGVPVCRDSERCGEVAARLQKQGSGAEVVVALDEDGMACGWATRDRLVEAESARTISEVMDEDIPTVPPDIPAETAAQLMSDRGVEHLFLMHDWPGEPRPSAVISLKSIEERAR